MFAEVGRQFTVEVTQLCTGFAWVVFDSDEKGKLPYSFAKTDFKEGDRINVIVTSKEPGRHGGSVIQVEEV